MNSVNSLANLRSRLERFKGKDPSTCSNNTQEIACRPEDVTDNRTWLNKIETQGNRAEDWLEYTRYISQKTKFPNRVQQHNYLCDIYEKALTAIPTHLNKKNEAYANLFVEYATIKSYVLPEEAIQLMSQARNIVRRFAIVHIMAADLEFKQGNNEKAMKILQKASQLHAEPEEKIEEAIKRLETGCNSLMPEQRSFDKEELHPVPHKSPVADVRPEPRRNLPMRVKKMNLKFREMIVSSDIEEENKENESFSCDIKPLDSHTTHHTFASSGYNSMLDVTIPMETKEIHPFKEEEVPKRLDTSVTTSDGTTSGHVDSVMRHNSDRFERRPQVAKDFKPVPLGDVPIRTCNPVSAFQDMIRPNFAKSESLGVLQTSAEKRMMLKSISDSGLSGLQSKHCSNIHHNSQQKVTTHQHDVVNPSVAHQVMPSQPSAAPTVPERLASPPLSTKLGPPAQPNLVILSRGQPTLSSSTQHSTGQQSAVCMVTVTPSQPKAVIQSTVPQQYVAPLPSVIPKQNLAPPLPVMPPEGKVPVSNIRPPTVEPKNVEPTPVKQASRNTQDVVMSTPSMKGIPPPPIPSTPSVQMDITVHGQTYWVLKLVGKGGSSQVYKVMNSNLEILAIKVVNLSDANQQVLEGYRNEIQLLERLQYCPKVIRMFDYEYIEEKSLLYIVMEYGSVDFAMYIKTKLHKDGQLSDNTMKFYWEDMLQAVGALHKEGIIHSDLKPANFLVIDGNLKLIDFGIAKTIQQDKTSIVVDTQVGTLNYMSPETIMESCGGGENFDENGKKRPVYKIGVKSDVWSLGCILYCMVYGHTPFQKITKIFIKFQAICNPNFPIEFKEIPDRNLLDVLKKCLTRDPKMRPGIDELLAHPYVTNNDTKMETDCDNLHLERLVKQLAEKFSSSPGGIRSLVHSAIKKDGGS